MKSCEQWLPELTEQALGAAPSVALAKHLQECSACSAAFLKLKTRANQIDSTLQQLVSAEPSADATHRILAQLPQRLRPDAWWSSRKVAVFAFAVLLIAAVSLSAVWQQRKQRADTERTLSAAASLSNWKSPTQDLLHSSYDALEAAPPRLGDYFYPLNTNASNQQHQVVPEKDEKRP